MKILVFSDSHGYIKNFGEILKNYEDEVTYVIHLGDYDRDVEKVKPFFTNYKFINISGNCDFGTLLPSEKIFILSDKIFFITHGHKYGVKSNIIRLAHSAEEKNANICLFGHTHIPVLTSKNNIIYMNPGSITQPRGNNQCSYGIINISGKNSNIEAKIIEIPKKVIYIINQTEKERK